MDGFFDVLSDQMRRTLLDLLRGTDTTTVGRVAADLVEAGGARFNGIQQVEAELHHVHLPKIAEVGW